MTPVGSRNNRAYGVAGKAVPSGDAFLHFSTANGGPYLQNLFGRQLRLPIVFSSTMEAERSIGVKRVFGARHIFEIFRPIVGLNSVFVVYLWLVFGIIYKPIH